MKSLQSKIEQAANNFQTHNFKKALQLYDQCIGICKKNQEPKSLLLNLMSSKGALHSILGDQKAALECLNEALSEDPYNSLCLIRRSQVFKKKNQLKKALKDLQIVSLYSPDNLQLAAMKVQIENLKQKNKNQESSDSDQSAKSSQSESDSDIDLDDEEKLNFSNLKNIDRKSVSIMITPLKQRKSRVTISGDIAIQYDAQDDNEQEQKSSNSVSTKVSKEYVKEKYLKTFRQIELDEEQESGLNQKQVQNVPKIVVKSNNNGRTKSILKNRDSKLYIDKAGLSENKNLNPNQRTKKYGGRQSKMVDLLKNIDGKVISTNSYSERSSKEVEFRKSIFGSPEQFKVSTPSIVKSDKPKSRKSCLKRSSFDQLLDMDKSVNSNEPRRSKFQRLSKVGIDGIVIKNHRKSIQNQASKQNINNSSDDSDEGSEHNIFGSNQVVLSKEIRQNLGLPEEDSVNKKPKQQRSGGGKSILKKNSLLFANKSSDRSQVKIQQKQEEAKQIKQVKKAKKSVMFTKVQ